MTKPRTIRIAAGEPQTLSYSVDGAAKAIGVHRATVWRLIGEGELTTYSIGRRKLIPRESIEAFITRRLAACGGRAGARTAV